MLSKSSKLQPNSILLHLVLLVRSVFKVRDAGLQGAVDGSKFVAPHRPPHAIDAANGEEEEAVVDKEHGEVGDAV